MEYYIAQKVKESWGKKTCDHPKLEKEYYSGAFLVNWICTQCGREFTIAEKLGMDQERKLVHDLI
jgi:hydrogenase maturation factor HypF (carbamoyltransferase family)